MVKRLSDEATKKRLRAARLLLKGEKPAEVALEVGVARQTVYTWKALLDEGGIEALRSVPSRGRPARLDESQLEGLRQAILQKVPLGKLGEPDDIAAAVAYLASAEAKYITGQVLAVDGGMVM